MYMFSQRIQFLIYFIKLRLLFEKVLKEAIVIAFVVVAVVLQFAFWMDFKNRMKMFMNKEYSRKKI